MIHFIDNHDNAVIALLAGTAVIGGVLVLGALALANQVIDALQQLA